MSIIDQAKEIAGLIKKIGDIELYRKIVELEGEIIELTRSKHELEDAKQNLEVQLALKKSMTFKVPFYFQDADPVPFCPHCWEKNSQTVHLAGSPPHDPRCYECGVCLVRYEICNYAGGKTGWAITRFAKQK